MSNETVKSFSDGEVVFWIEQETIHLKVSEPHGDSVELTEDEAKKFATALLEAVRHIEVQGSN